MSFVKALATLAVGFAAAKGYDKYKDMGGMAGVQKAVQDNPALANLQDQTVQMMEKMGMPTDQLKRMAGQVAEQAGVAQQSAMAGLGGLMTALGGGMAAGGAQAGSMIDAMTGTTAATDTMEENAKLMIRAMIQAAKSDGQIDSEEQERIMEHIGDLGKTERAFIEAELAAPVDPAALAADASDQMKAQVYATSLMAIRVDTVSEATYLQELADALGLSAEARARIHKSMGVA